MRKWFKACILLTILGIITLLIDIAYGYQIDNYFGNYFGYHTISIFGTYPNASLGILLLVVIIFVLAYFAFLMEAKPVLDREILGKKQTM